MASYRIVLRRSAAKELEAIPLRDRKRLVARIAMLAADPRPQGVEKLGGQERYRVRQGDYRIVYEIEDEVLTVVAVRVGHRRDVYR